MITSEELVRKLWVDVWVAVAKSDNVVNSNVPTQWADRAVKDYKERFKDIKENTDFKVP